jgi:CheY-like chemotaxis protein
LRIYLPLSAGNVAVECDRPTDKPASFGANETVMVVEDQDMVREFVVESLRENGYSVLEARNGPEALGLLEQGKAEVHLLMTDVLMPGMRGNELAARARAVCPSMKVLFMTGYADGSINHSNWRDGKEEVIMKPFSPEVLEARVRDLLGPVRPGARNGSVLVSSSR